MFILRLLIEWGQFGNGCLSPRRGRPFGHWLPLRGAPGPALRPGELSPVPVDSLVEVAAQLPREGPGLGHSRTSRTQEDGASPGSLVAAAQPVHLSLHVSAPWMLSVWILYSVPPAAAGGCSEALCVAWSRPELRESQVEVGSLHSNSPDIQPAFSPSNVSSCLRRKQLGCPWAASRPRPVALGCGSRGGSSRAVGGVAGAGAVGCSSSSLGFQELHERQSAHRRVCAVPA